MRAKKLVMCSLAVLTIGCAPIVSLHPLFTKETIVFDEKLLGTWAEVNDPAWTWEFARLENVDTDTLPEGLRDSAQRVYRLNLLHTEEGRKGSFIAAMVKLENRLFLDIFPDKLPSGEQDVEKLPLSLNAFLFVAAHTFVRVDVSEERLQIGLTINEQFEKLLKAEPNAVRHEMIEDRPILTASTQELQAFVLKYADDERLFLGDITLVRKSQ